MTMALGSFVFALLAGILSVLSPCVLPILPVILGTAAARHRFASAALVGGVVLSFTGVGLFVATVGFSLGLDAGVFRSIGATALLGFGLVLLSTQLQDRFSLAAGRLSATLSPLATNIAGETITGQFFLGLTLGLVWSPCVGPTLGAASLMAAEGNAFVQVMTIMLAFAIGATFPLIVLGHLSRRIGIDSRGSLLVLERRGKAALGAIAGVVGLSILSGLDRPLEAFLVEISPGWLTRLTTTF